MAGQRGDEVSILSAGPITGVPIGGTPMRGRALGAGGGSGLVVKYGNLPGSSGSFFGTPDSVANSIASDIDIRVNCSLSDWTPASDMAVISKYVTTGNQRSWLFMVTSAGRLYFLVSPDGAGVPLATSTASVSVSDGETIWIRVTWKQSTSECKFYTSSDGESWVQLGSTRTLTSAGIYNSTANIHVSGFNFGTSSQMTGKVYRAKIFNGINGTLAVDFNPVDHSGGSTWVSAATGEEWTIAGSASVVTV